LSAASTHSFSHDDIRSQVDRVVASAGFAGSDRMCRFLRFVVERELAGRGRELKEYTLGTEVFDRDASYDPRIDPIVRVEARRLRSKLREYYTTTGVGDSLVIDLPKGSYVPQFHTAIAARAVQGPSPAASAPAGRSVVVLPFANPAADPEAEYLADGLSQQLIHRLTRIQGVRVLGWHSAARLRDSHDVFEAAHELNACFALTGTIRRSGGRLRVSVQFVDTGSRTFVWSEFYDRPSSDLFAIEEDIAEAIVAALRVQLGVERQAPASTPEAYDLYFRGRYHWSKRTEAGFRSALTYLRQALDVDPSFALAWAGLADSLILLAEYGLEAPERTIEPARSAARRALELSPGLGEAEANLGIIAGGYEWSWDAADDHYRRAMQLSPGYATAFHWYAVDQSAIRGRFTEASEALETALQLDPLSSSIREGRSFLMLLQHRFDEAIREAMRVIDFDRSFVVAHGSLGRAYIEAGAYSLAVEVLEKASSMATPSPSLLGALGQAHALNGNPQRARELLCRLYELERSRFVGCACFAAVHLGLGEHSEAIRWLAKGCERRDFSVAKLAVHPLYDPLRSEPAFQALVDRVGAVPRQ
jgi:serine/threonine-protein kinase